MAIPEGLLPEDMVPFLKKKMKPLLVYDWSTLENGLLKPGDWFITEETPEAILRDHLATCVNMMKVCLFATVHQKTNAK